MKFAQFDGTNVLCARYDSEVHGSEVPADAVEVSEDEFWRSINETDGIWKRDPKTGAISKFPFPPPTAGQVQAQKVSVVQRHMDAVAQSLKYDNIANAVTYADEPAVPKFQAEGQALRAWRSLVWATCYAVLDDVIAGTRDVPTDKELIAELPSLVLPESAG